jgi:hypothetical protein
MKRAACKGKQARRKQFFFEKKNQKKLLLPALRTDPACRASQQSKSFLVLFFKKELLSC